MTTVMDRSFEPITVDGVTIYRFGRDDFRYNRFDYQDGEHAVFAGPTQRGKTTLAFALIEPIASEDFPVYIAVSKPADKVTTRETRRQGFKLVREWPPPAKRIKEAIDKPHGYTVWPKFGDLETDIYNASDVTRRLIQERYRAAMKGEKGVLVLDDTMIKSKVLGLDQDMTTILAMSGAMGLGGWYFVQKPTGSGTTAIWSYSQSEHIFVFRDPDRRNRQRYDEIGGFDPHLVEAVTLQLKPYEALYMKRTGGHMCVVMDK